MHLPVTEITVRRHDTILNTLKLSLGDYVIGGLGADIVVDDEFVSHRHARLSIRHHEILVEDLGSGSGTYIHQRRVAACTRLFPTQTLHLGPNVRFETKRLNAKADDQESLTPQSAALLRLLPSPDLGHRKYEIGELVGKGGMGAVLEARDVFIQRTVAMKVMLNGSSEQSIARFIAEARLTGQLQHPNIVPVHEFGVDEHDQPFYTMKYVRGVTLHAVLKSLHRREPDAITAYPLTELLTIFQKVCDAVAFAHSERVIHRDLKPENIMLGEYGEVLVMDWGLAKTCRPGSTQRKVRPALSTRIAEKEPERTLEGTLLGTPHFMPPEQARGEAVDFRGDIYALGAILYAILHLRPPVSGDSVEEILENVRQGRIGQAVGQLRETHSSTPWRRPDSLVAVTSRAMAMQPADRYQTVGEIQAEITAYRGGFATAAERATPWRLFRLTIGRYKRESALLAAFVCVLTIGGAMAFLKLTRERNRAETALEDLRGSAPAFAAQARSLAAQEEFAGALEKLNYALTLHPHSADYLLAKGDLLRCQLRLTAAAAVYREAEHAQPGGRGRLAAELCESLQTTASSDGKLPRESLSLLFDAMLAEGRPPFEPMQIARLLGVERQIALAYWRERLRDLPIEPEPPIEKRLTSRTDGLLGLDLSLTSISDLQPLADMPLAELNLAGCNKVQSLVPLRNLPLVRLNLEGTSVADLSPLRGSRLESLNASRTLIANVSGLDHLPLRSFDCAHVPALDFSPLQGLPIESLRLDGTQVRDLAFLQGMPLKFLSLGGCSDARNFQVLTTLRDLQVLVLPRNLEEFPAEELASVQALQNHPSLRQITSRFMEGMHAGSVGGKESFWKEWAADLAWLNKLRATGISTTLLSKLPDGSWEVDIRDQPLRDLSCLTAAPISKLVLFNVPVSDLRPLAGMKLRWLDLRLTLVTDLAPLRQMPLRKLYLWRTKVEDFSALETLTELELLDAPETELTDLSVIKSRQLNELRIGSTRVADLSPLAGLPLERLHCDNIPATDLRPLLQCPTLKWLVPPNSDVDVAPLRTLPNLERISYLWGKDSEPTLTASEFWSEWDRSHSGAPH
jgi:eukaryotic-like serine/threonine-protein kinase